MAKRSKSASDDVAELIEVRCITKVRHNDPRARVQYIGGIRRGVTWKLSQADAIAGMESGDLRFYTQIKGHSLSLLIGTSEEGRRYLKTSIDGEYPTNLLSLPECPRSSRRLETQRGWGDVERE